MGRHITDFSIKSGDMMVDFDYDQSFYLKVGDRTLYIRLGEHYSDKIDDLSSLWANNPEIEFNRYGEF